MSKPLKKAKNKINQTYNVKTSKLSTKGRKRVKYGLGLLIIGLALGSVWVYLEFFAIQPTTGTITFQVYDPLRKGTETGTVADVTEKTDVTAWESPDLTDLSTTEILELDFNDDYHKLLDTTTADKASVEITDNHIIILCFEYEDSQYWVLATMPADGGTVFTVYMYAQTDSLSSIAICDDDNSEALLNTDQPNWHIDVVCDNHEGLMGGYHYDDDLDYSKIVIFTFDNVPVEDDVDIADYDETKTVNGNALYCELNGNLPNTETISFTFSDDVIAGTPNIVSISVNYGQSDNLLL